MEKQTINYEKILVNTFMAILATVVLVAGVLAICHICAGEFNAHNYSY